MNRAEKSESIGNTLFFTADDIEARFRIRPELPHSFVDIVSIDANGDPAQPTTGTYSVYVQDVQDGGFKELSDGGLINAINTAGVLLADGVQCGASFDANPISIKIVPAGVDVATHYRATVRQNLS